MFWAERRGCLFDAGHKAVIECYLGEMRTEDRADSQVSDTMSLIITQSVAD